jgi:hypothetical protein
MAFHFSIRVSSVFNLWLKIEMKSVAIIGAGICRNCQTPGLAV